MPIILINNGIHPGEPDGIDATMMMMRDFATGKIRVKNLKIVVIQAYNISGMLPALIKMASKNMVSAEMQETTT